MDTEWFLFYGSLRRDMHNFKTYEPHLEYHYTVKVGGFRMYALPRYPYVVRSNITQDQIVAELFRIRDHVVRKTIHQMELGAGFVCEYVTVDFINAGIYLFEKAGNESLVESGDWAKFFGKTDALWD